MSVLRSLVIAFACFSKLPMPRVDWEPRAMRYSMCFFPLIGLVIGLIIWGWLALAAWLDLGVLLRATGVLLVSLAVTGGIHMDGFADVVDAQSSHAEPERKRQILKDPHTGAFAIIGVAAYLLAYLFMLGLGALLPGMKAVIYGFNFLLGVLAASLVKLALRLLKKAGVVKRDYVNSFLMTRVSNFCFDLMVVAGIAAIRLGVLENYWGVILILGVLGAVLTYYYNLFVAKKLFPEYEQEQFLMMYGMLTGTASTGTILLREIDPDFRTPAADNMVYQNFPAIVFGFPMMLLATLAPKRPVLTLGILALFFLVMNLILFRRSIFKRRSKS